MNLGTNNYIQKILIKYSLAMKKQIFLFFSLLIISSTLFAQNDTTFFDSSWEKSERSNASYFRIVEVVNSTKFILKDYYINGQIQMKGEYSDDNLKVENGTFIYYEENGTISSTGDYKNGEKNGSWSWYFSSGKISSKEDYKNDERSSAKFFDENGNEVAEEIAEYMPEYLGGEKEMFKVIYSNIVYPTIARDGGLEGLVIIQFIVDEEGNVINPKVVKSVHPSIDEEALKAINRLGKFKQGKLHNKIIKVRLNVPVRFRLTEEDK